MVSLCVSPTNLSSFYLSNCSFIFVYTSCWVYTCYIPLSRVGSLKVAFFTEFDSACRVSSLGALTPPTEVKFSW